MSTAQRVLAHSLLVLSLYPLLSSHAATPMVAGGMQHVLYLADNGTVWSWGNNASGQLGADPGLISSRNQPRQVAGLSNVVAISAGAHHSLALTADGTVLAWGHNIYGQLGQGSADSLIWQPTVVATLPPHRIKAIAAGGYHCLALDTTGHVWGWGYNGTGAVGAGNTTTPQPTPVQVTTPSLIRAIAGGGLHSLAITDSGTVLAWGYNASGQLGNGNNSSQSSPVAVSGLANIMTISAGYSHSAASTASGLGYAWGGNACGQLGNGSTIDSSTPVSLSAALVTRVLAFGTSTLVLRSNGYISLCGDNGSGQCLLPLATTHQLTLNSPGTPVRNGMVNGLGSFLAFITLDGEVNVCGDNSSGEFGTGSDAPSASYTRQRTMANWPVSRIVSATFGQYHAAALKSDGTVWSWGYNANGQIGDGTTNLRGKPVPTLNLSSATAISAGTDYGDHTLALNSYGQVYAWGRNDSGQTGDGTTTTPRTTPAVVSGLSACRAITAGDYHSLAVDYTGSVKSWGSNAQGQLGDGTTANTSTPVSVSGLFNIVAVSAGTHFSAALHADGTVWTWGSGSSGQLGNGTTASTQPTPAKVPGLTGVIAITAGGYHALALKSDGSVWAWGHNSYGQLGINSTGYATVPTQVRSEMATNILADIRAISASSFSSFAIDGGGRVHAWGQNSGGQFGNGLTTSSLVPLENGQDNAGAIDSGYLNSVVTLANGEARCWGGNSMFQCGTGASTPSPVLTPAEPLPNWYPYVTISPASPDTLIETNPGSASLTVTRTGPDGTSTSTAGSLPVAVAPHAGSTARPSDYTLSALTIPPAQTSATFTVTPHHNRIAENNTTVITALQPNPSAYNLGTPVATTVTIVNTDIAGITLSTNQVIVTESNAVPPALGTGSAVTVTVSLQTDPVSNVVLQVSNNQTDRCLVAPSQVILTGGTNGSWQSGRPFTVTASNNYVADGDRPFLLSVQVSSASTDWQGKYRELAALPISGTCVDDLSGSVCAPLGTPVSWLSTYAITNTPPAVAETNDADHDSMLAWQEYVAGTDPTNAASALRVVDISPDSITFAPALSNRSYAVFWATHLATTPSGWQPLAPFQSLPGSASTLPLDTSATQRFYRIGVSLP